jgi:hypothetical protein
MAENYDIVTITVQASAYDASKPPQFAKVKYNKLCPLITTSDDMGAGELIRNWAFFNGYPVFANDAYGQIAMGNDFLDSPYSASAWAQQVRSLKRDSHSPLTYSDNTGGVRRFTGTSAIWPHQVNNTNSTLIKIIQNPRAVIPGKIIFPEVSVQSCQRSKHTLSANC